MIKDVVLAASSVCMCVRLACSIHVNRQEMENWLAA